VTEEVSVTTPDHEPEQLADEAVAAEAVETTEADAVAEFDACDEVAVAVRMKRLVGRFGAATLA
jgi:hypothetical protein